MNRELILEGVRASLGKVLDIDPGPIKAKDRVIDDLGADSLDLLDLVFHLEKHFGIKIKPGQIEKRAQEHLGGAPLEIDGVYTAEALASLREAMPEVPAAEILPGMGSAQLPRVFRVQTFVNIVALLLWEQGRFDDPGENSRGGLSLRTEG